MAPQSSISALRAVSFRISSASKSELPHVVACVSQSLTACKDLLSNQELVSQKDADAAVVISRFNTQITTLLQDRTVEGRWAAIVLVKAAIEAGGWESLRKSNPWVRGLLTILKKPDAPVTKCLCIITLCRVFMLTWAYPTLVREITTPALPTFVSTCLANLNARPHSQEELRATLECFAQLIPHHPTIFRTHQDTIGKLLQSGFDAPKMTVPTDIKDLACRVSVLLHQCEPKGGASEKWEKSLAAIVRSAHAVADKAFIGIEEDWQSVAGNNANKHALNSLYHQSQDSKDASERPVQQFVVAGSDNLISQLRLITGYFSLATPANVTANVGAVSDLLTRLLAVTVSQTTSRSSIKFSRDTTREEREGLTQVLPDIHLAALEALSSMLDRYGQQLAPTLQSVVDQLIWIFNAESSDSVVKTAVYIVAHKTLELAGPTLNKQTVASLRKMITTCCEDLVPSKAEAQPEQAKSSNGVKAPQATMNADSFLKQPKSAGVSLTQLAGLQKAAWTLLPTLLSKLPAKYIPVALRSLMDRVAAILRHKDAMIASTLNPPSNEGGKGANSLLPLLAREYAWDAQVEALLRPRMPIIETGRRTTTGQTLIDEDEEEENDEDAGEDVDMSDAAVEDDQGEATAAAAAGTESTTAPNAAATATAAEVEKGKNLVTEALDAYKSAPAPAPAPQPSEAKAPEVKLGKRTRSSSSAKAATGDKTTDKRRRSSRLQGPEPDSADADAGALGSVTVVEPVVVVSATAAATAEKVDDEEESDGEGDFEIPQLVMGADSDEEDEEE